MNHIRITFLLLLLAGHVLAQTEYRFSSGLVLPNCHSYGREAVVTDQVAWLMNSGRLTRPAEEAKVFTDKDGAEIAWKVIETDSTGKFKGDVLQNAYIFLSYRSDREVEALLNITGNSMVYVNGEPHTGDIYADGWMNIPVSIKAGENHLYIRCGGFARWQGISAKLVFPEKKVMLNVDDLTLPHIVLGESKGLLTGAVVVINGSNTTLQGLSIDASINGKATVTKVAKVRPGTIRKIAFNFDATAIQTKGDHRCTLILKEGNKVIDGKTIAVTAVNALDHHSYTFRSNIDGSIQYYSVAPSSEEITRPALFLSVHGAGVQAIGQARAYTPKDWGVLVAPTNRRPRGFNWEDWGRMDALEVLELAKKRYNPDPARIYLTGHSMGGHGTWYLGATYPDRWAAIAPCAGYPTLKAYGSSDGKIPDQSKTATQDLLLRASNGSDVIALAPNYNGLGVYIHHGDDDQVVSVDYARQMRALLGGFHNDFSYFEYPGGSHWFGNESVDWKPIFDFFKWHTLQPDTGVNKVVFTTANPGISSTRNWASIIQQQSPLALSKINLEQDRNSGAITGSTVNVATVMLKTPLNEPGDSITLTLDSVKVSTVVNETGELWLSRSPDWKIVPKVTATQKNPLRAGPFKEAFNHNMVFVYGTQGTSEEQKWAYSKARYDAEVWYYRGNGSVDIIPDVEFDLAAYRDRGVILYGNSKTNSAWRKLLANCPVNVTSNAVTVGKEVLTGSDLGIYFTWPRHDSDTAMVAVVAGTGLQGMRATDPNQYFAAASGFPDFLIFSSRMLIDGVGGIKAAGFFDNEWSLRNATVVMEEGDGK